MKVKFYPERKLSRTGESLIWCYVREAKETVYLNTGQKIKPELWDSNSQRGNPRLTRNNIIKGDLKSLNQYLDKLESKIYDIERLIRGKQSDAGFGIISDAIKKQFNKRKTGFFDIYDEFISIKKLEVTKESIQKLERVKSLLEDYQKEYDERLDFDKITPLFFTKIYSFLINQKKMLNNTANKNISFLKTFIIWANTNGFTDNSSYKNYKSKSETNEVICLTEDELMKLYNLNLEEERLERVRDIFVFQCFTGVRYSDIENISSEDIRNSIWHVRTQKTRQIIEIPLSDYALSILAKYSDFQQPLPVISNQKMNTYLKELCKIAEINEAVKVVRYKGNERIEKIYKKYEVIGTHTARRTFISLSLQKGMSAELIMAFTGHKHHKMMQRYLKITDTYKREAMHKTWESSLKLVKNN